MSEIPEQTGDVLVLPPHLLLDTTRHIKSANFDPFSHLDQVDVFAERFPSLAVPLVGALEVLSSLDLSDPKYTMIVEGSVMPTAQGIFASYLTFMSVEEKLGARLPEDDGKLQMPEWAQEIIVATLGEVEIEAVEGTVTSVVNSLKGRHPAYYQVATRMIARPMMIPVREIDEAVQVFGTIDEEHSTMSEMKLMQVNSFLAGYAMTVMAMEDLVNKEKLAQLEF